ncbi:MAG: hypothetical protein QF732_05210, partial [Nitrospinaceae bacterium]|nr:hypothetical protein [Nitrospinaceae bacterium]
MMFKNSMRVLAYLVLASTFVLTQGFLAGIPLVSNGGVAVALTAAEKAEQKADKKAARADKKAARADKKAARA